MNVVDSSGWIEFFNGSKSGLRFKPIIADTDHLLVPVIALYEVRHVLSRSLPEAVVNECLDVMRMGRVLELTDKRAIAAAEVAQRYRLAMADAVMYSMALEFDATFWTQDVDYQDLPKVEYLPKTI